MAKKESNSGHSFLAYFKRATSPLVVLSLLLERPMYGYEVSQEMKRRELHHIRPLPGTLPVRGTGIY